MTRYYKPALKEIVFGARVEVYDGYGVWIEITVDNVRAIKRALKTDDVRMKYAEADDFKPLDVKRTKIGTEEIVVDILEDGKEIKETVDVHDNENLVIIGNSGEIGFFYPYEPFDNVRIKGEKYTVKNKNEVHDLLTKLKLV